MEGWTRHLMPLGLEAHVLGIITDTLTCATKFCPFHWLHYSIIFRSQECRLCSRKPLGTLTTQPLPISGLGGFSGASSHESPSRNCLSSPRKDGFLRGGYPEGSDGGRAPPAPPATWKLTDVWLMVKLCLVCNLMDYSATPREDIFSRADYWPPHPWKNRLSPVTEGR